MSTSNQSVLAWMRLFADETRLRLMEIVADGEQGVEELAAAVGVKAPTVSHHLTKLRDAGVVRVRADANRRLHRLDHETLQRACAEIAAHFGLPTGTITAGDAADQQTADTTPGDPVDQYLEQGQIVTIPAQRTARLLVLDWVAKRFDPTAAYREADVTRELAEVSPDPDNLRRLLLDYGLMHRVGKTYWLSEDPRR